MADAGSAGTGGQVSVRRPGVGAREGGGCLLVGADDGDDRAAAAQRGRLQRGGGAMFELRDVTDFAVTASRGIPDTRRAGPTAHDSF